MSQDLLVVCQGWGVKMPAVITAALKKPKTLNKESEVRQLCIGD